MMERSTSPQGELHTGRSGGCTWYAGSLWAWIYGVLGAVTSVGKVRQRRMSETDFHLDFFGFQEQPFAPTADPVYFYATRAHKECLFRLWSSIDQRHGIAVVLGNYGTGKTTLLRKLITGMTADPERYNTAVVGSPIPSWTSFALLESIVGQFGLRPQQPSFAVYMEALNEYLLSSRDRISTLIIDDAQNLNKRGQIELLRLVQNLETQQHKLLNLVLFAQLEWVQVLRAAPNFEQRINVTYTLEPIRPEEMRHLIGFRLRQAGARPGMGPEFDDAAFRVIYAYAEGNPRVVVTLCRNALLVAAQTKTRRIGSEIIVHTIEKTTVPDGARRARAMEAAAAAEHTLPSSPGARTEAAGGLPERMMPPAASLGRPATAQEQRASQLLLRAAKARVGESREST